MKDQIKNLLSIHWILTITIAVIAVLQFAIFGVVGLATYFVLLVYNVIGLIYCWKVGKKKIYNCPTLFFGIAYCVMYIVASLINGNFVNSTTTIIQYLLILTLSFFIRPDCEIIKNVITISKVLTVAGIAMSVLSVLLAVLGTAFPILFENLPSWEICNVIRGRICDIKKERLIGFAGNPNTTAFYCYTCLVSSIFLISVEKKTKWKFFSVFNIFVCIVVIFFLSNSRTYMLSFAIFIFSYFITCYLFAYKESKNRLKAVRFFLLLCGALLIVVIALVIFVPSFRDFLLVKFLRIDSVKTIGNREEIFKSAVIMGSKHRVFGINSDIFEEQVAFHTHNMYLEIITFAGIPCFILFICYLAFATGVSVRNFNWLKKTTLETRVLNCYVFSFLLGYFVGGLTETGGVSSMRLIFPVLQVLIASICVLQCNYSENKQ